MMWAVLIPYVILHSLNTLLLKYVAALGFSTSETIFFRGLGCAAVTVAVAFYRRDSLFPRHPKEQIIRFVLAGASLTLLAASFHYARATTVSALSRLDTALLLILGPIAAVPVSASRRWMAAALALVVVALALLTRGPEEKLIGFALALLATAGLTLGFLLMKRTGQKESIEVTALVAALALVAYGLMGDGATAHPPQIPLVFSIFSGVIMYAIYALTLNLYRHVHIALAEYPTLLSTILVLPLEQNLLGTSVSSAYFLSVLMQLAGLGILLLPSGAFNRIRETAIPRILAPRG